MDVVSMCPLRVASVVWQPRPGVLVMTVACKATYRLEPGVSPLAEVQEEVRARDACWDDRPSASVYAPSDLAPYKRCADVLVVGSAWAPGGRPVRSLVATLELGEIHKSIEVHGDRAFSYDGRLIEGAAFTRMPLRWERAAGGAETANPVGMRFDAAPNAEGRVPIPNLQPPWKQIAWPGDTFEPIGFGPIAPWWQGRAWQLHRHLAGWSHDRWFERPLPTDIDPRYFNAAPSDQQVDALPADARIVLENLSAKHPRLVTNLALVRPRTVAERPGRAAEPITLAPDTLWIDTDRGLATLTFRGSTSLARADEAGRVVVTLEGEASAARRGRAATIEGAALPAGALPFVAAKTVDETETQPLKPFVARGLPFRAAPAPPLPSASASPSEASEGGRKGGLSFVLGKASATALGLARLTPGAPEAEPNDVAPDSAPAPKLAEPEPAPRAASDPVLPFVKRAGGVSPAVPPPATPPPLRRPAWGEEPTATIEIERLRRQSEALPFGGAPAADGSAGGSPAFWQRMVESPAGAARDEDAEPETLRPPAPETPPPAFTVPAAPPVASFAVADLSAPAREPFQVTPVREPLPSIAERRPSLPAEPAALPVEAYATAKVASWRPDGGPRAGLDEALRVLGLDEDAYRAGEERLIEALATEAREGRATLARALRAAIKAAARRAGEIG